MFDVKIKRKIEKKINKLPTSIQGKFEDLVFDLEEKGPIQNNWPNYSKLKDNEYHCHLSYS